MKFTVTSAEFVTGSPDIQHLPTDPHPEFAFIGRSNVGKSSLINMLCARKKLAHTSGTPGKTRMVNLFRINNRIHLADLPGYGFAKAGKSIRESFEGVITTYLLDREQLRCLFVLIDVRLPLQAIDLEFMKWLGEKEIPFAIVFTKADKLSRTELEKNLKDYTARLLRWWEDLPGIFITSSLKQSGREDLLNYIGELAKTKKP
ncbi:MAG: YihA family ribosome biogenesis GTP-binding protein [Bacteroidia bacterium]|nr:YihA family ribosome biogenesis GTP-binding protein [Bacteroidia bacterium]